MYQSFDSINCRKEGNLMKVYFPFSFYFVKITGNIVTNIHLNSLNTIQSQYADLQTGSEKLHPCDIYHEAKIRYEPSKNHAKKVKHTESCDISLYGLHLMLRSNPFIQIQSQ